MKCPQCNLDLQMTERSAVEIDYCPQCRGVWLDRGELDKIIERAASPTFADETDFERGGRRAQYHNDDDDRRTGSADGQAGSARYLTSGAEPCHGILWSGAASSHDHANLGFEQGLWQRGKLPRRQDRFGA
jgi:Zn-finger nucleic acid-binding protein